MKYTFFAVAISLFLAACSDNSAGVSAGSSSSSTADSGSVIAKMKAITATEESSTNVKMPALAIIAEAFAERVPGHASDDSRMDDARKGNNPSSTDLRMLGGLVYSLRTNNREDFEKQFQDKKGTELYTILSEGKSGDEIGDALVRIRMQRRIASCTSPLTGWEYLPTKKDAHLYIESMANACDFANLIYTELAAKIGNRALKNPADAAQEVLSNWDALPVKVIEEAWESVVSKNKGAAFSANGTGVQGVQFTGPGGTYWNQGGGFVILKNGTKWFGDGAISGKVIDFNLRSSLGTKTEKSKSQSSSQGQQSGSKTGAEIGIK